MKIAGSYGRFLEVKPPKLWKSYAWDSGNFSLSRQSILRQLKFIKTPFRSSYLFMVPVVPAPFKLTSDEVLCTRLYLQIFGWQLPCDFSSLMHIRKTKQIFIFFSIVCCCCKDGSDDFLLFICQNWNPKSLTYISIYKFSLTIYLLKKVDSHILNFADCSYGDFPHILWLLYFLES